MQRWTRRNTRDAILIAVACFVLPLLSIPYWPGFGSGTNASLAHLQWGLLLALAMLSPHKLYFRIGYLSLFLAWCVQLLWRSPPDVMQLLLRSLPLYAAMYGWTVLCAHWMGWPRPPEQARIRQRDIVPFGAIALILVAAVWFLSQGGMG